MCASQCILIFTDNIFVLGHFMTLPYVIDLPDHILDYYYLIISSKILTVWYANRLWRCCLWWWCCSLCAGAPCWWLMCWGHGECCPPTIPAPSTSTFTTQSIFLLTSTGAIGVLCLADYSRLAKMATLADITIIINVNLLSLFKYHPSLSVFIYHSTMFLPPAAVSTLWCMASCPRTSVRASTPPCVPACVPLDLQ